MLNTIDESNRPVTIQTGLALPGGEQSAHLALEVPGRRRRVDAAWIQRAVAAADWAILAGFAAAVSFAAYDAPIWAVALGALAPVFLVALAMKAGLWSASAYHQAPIDAHAGDAALGLLAAAGVSVGAVLAFGAEPRLACSRADRVDAAGGRVDRRFARLGLSLDA